MKTQTPRLSRQQLLETCFCDLPQKVGNIPLRNLSAGSFSLLGRLDSPMMQGGANDNETIFQAVILYVWIHSADLDTVCLIETSDDLPKAEINKLGFNIDFGDALGFLEIYKRCTARMAIALAEVEELDDDDEPGKRKEPAVQNRAGSPLSSMPSADAPTPSANATSFGSSPSNEPFATSTLPTSPTEPVADGLVLPTLTRTTHPDSETPK
jgi:hypothetical protein